MKRIPIAERLRPASLADILGQTHLVGEGKPLRLAVENNRMHSMILWGPPGVGKTTLAKILAKEAGLIFISLSAVSAGVKEVRAVIDQAKKAGQIVFFLDEIHRFNKSQQDSLLGAVEQGLIILIGATTENPSFEVNNALLSRCQVYVLNELSLEDLRGIIARALKEDAWLEGKQINIVEDEALISLCGGDARKLLNMLELVSELSGDKIEVTNDLVESVVQQNMARYDKSGDQHYDIISAFIKSIRGSDPNASLYWLARMINGGEDPKFIARRLLILASEDIGNANPTAFVIANSCFQAVNTIGYPECRIILSQTVIYLACSIKSNASYAAINSAMALARKTASSSVPMHIRNAPTKLMKELSYGKGYAYAHAHEGGFADQEFFPDELSGTVFYNPGKNTREEDFRKRLKHWWGMKYKY
ncbi:MAG: replication-associated recombination protein A [Bacteroidetes bacterium]|nr:replication-associated recombination protein A [Bacteroidota bacterium]